MLISILDENNLYITKTTSNQQYLVPKKNKKLKAYHLFQSKLNLKVCHHLVQKLQKY